MADTTPWMHHPINSAEVPRTRGHFEELQISGVRLSVRGWMLNCDVDVDAFDLLVDGHLLASSAPRDRVDVSLAYPWLAHASRSGFAFLVPACDDASRVTVLGRKGASAACKMAVVLDSRVNQLPTPGPVLIRRSTGQDSAEMFHAEAQHSSTVFLDIFGRFTDLRLDRILDWGCGCGRLTAALALQNVAAELHGCDIDGEAVKWCSSHIEGATFQQIASTPPTPYADASFDVVIASSVLSHLSAAMQAVWARELKRILRPSGLLIASVHGTFAASFAFTQTHRSLMGRARRVLLLKLLAAKGVLALPDHTLVDVAPAGYYRATFQTQRWTIRKWSTHFAVIDYLEAGLGYQDVVVMRA